MDMKMKENGDGGLKKLLSKLIEEEEMKEKRDSIKRPLKKKLGKKRKSVFFGEEEREKKQKIAEFMANEKEAEFGASEGDEEEKKLFEKKEQEDIVEAVEIPFDEDMYKETSGDAMAVDVVDLTSEDEEEETPKKKVIKSPKKQMAPVKKRQEDARLAIEKEIEELKAKKLEFGDSKKEEEYSDSGGEIEDSDSEEEEDEVKEKEEEKEEDSDSEEEEDEVKEKEEDPMEKFFSNAGDDYYFDSTCEEKDVEEVLGPIGIELRNKVEGMVKAKGYDFDKFNYTCHVYHTYASIVVEKIDAIYGNEEQFRIPYRIIFGF